VFIKFNQRSCLRKKHVPILYQGKDKLFAGGKTSGKEDKPLGKRECKKGVIMAIKAF
jgi:hypothetical protein